MSFSFSEEFWLSSLSQFQQLKTENGTIRNDIAGAWGVFDLNPGGYAHVNADSLPLDHLSSFTFTAKVKAGSASSGSNKKIFVGLLGEDIKTIDETKSAGFVYDLDENVIYLMGTDFTKTQIEIDNAILPASPTYVVTSSSKYPGRSVLQAPASFWEFSIFNIAGQLTFSIDGKVLAIAPYSSILAGKSKLVIGCKAENCGAYLDNISFSGNI